MFLRENCTTRLRPLLLASAVTILSWPGVLLAQDAAQTTVETRGGGLDDIVVTARKRSESAQDIPVSVTALSAEQIERYDLTSLERVAASTPQFTVGRAAAGSGAQLTLRGIGSSSTSIGIEQSVAVVVDGVYYGQGRIINEGFFDLGRLEILKGPQALFFGKNATAGVVSITTADPGDKLEVIGRVGYEFAGRSLTGELIGSGPITDTLGLRVAVRASKMFGGLFENRGHALNLTSFDVATGAVNSLVAPAGQRDVPAERELLGRVTLKWQPTSQLTATIKASADSNKNDNPAWNYVPYACVGATVTNDPGVPCARAFNIYQSAIPLQMAASGLPFAKGGKAYNDYRSWSVSGTINYALDDVTITSISNYNWNRNTNGAKGDYNSSLVSGNNTWSTEDTSFHAFSSELRLLTTFDSPVNLLLGGLYQKTKRDFDQWVVTGGVEDSTAGPNRYNAFSKNSKTDGETLSAYGQVIWKIVPQVELTAGVRYTHETKDSNFAHPFVNPAFAGFFRPFNPADPTTFIVANQTFSNWSPDATATWKPTRDITVYGAYKTAYKSGGFSNSGIYSTLSPDPVGDFTFEPELAKGFEAGIKTTLLDRQLRFNVGVYSYRYSNLQVDFFNSQVFAFQTLNAGSATTKGIEVEFEFAPRAVDGLNIHGSINYDRARYENFLAPCYSGQTTAQGCLNTGQQGQDLSGKPTAVAPEWTGSLGASYEASVGGGLIFGASADARYSSSYLPSGFGNPLSRQPKYVNLDGSVRLRTEDERWELALIGKNITNRFIVTGVVDGPSTGSGTATPAGVFADQLGFASLPRTVQLQLTFRY